MKLRKLIGALALFSFMFDASAKQNGSVSMHGQLTETAVGSHQKQKFNKERGHMLLTMGSISFDGSVYDIRNRVKYTASLDLTADMSTVKQQNPVLNSAYLGASGKFGEVKIGNSFSAATELMIDGTQLLGADGGFSGTSTFSTFNSSAYSIIMTGCYYDPGYATQITYMTPNFKGFQAGVTYVPNSLHVGLLPENDSFNSMDYGMTAYADEAASKAIANKDLMAWGNGGFTSHVLAGGFRYDYGVPHHWNFSLSAVGWYGKANPGKKVITPYKMHNLTAISVGGTLGFKHIKVGFGYVNQFKSCLPKERSKLDTSYLNQISKEAWDYIAKGKEVVGDALNNLIDSGKFCGMDKDALKANGDLEAVPDKGNLAKAKEALIAINGFGENANAGQIFTGVISYLPGAKTKIALGGIYAIRKMAKSDKAKTYGGSLTFDYRVTQGVGLFAGVTYLKTKTCRRAMLISMSEAKSSGPFGDNNIVFASLGIKMNF